MLKGKKYNETKEYKIGKLIAIGGGKAGGSGFEYETGSIDKEIVRLTGKVNCNVLFIPTSSSDSERDITGMKDIFENKIGCKFKTLELTKKEYTDIELREHIGSMENIIKRL